MSAQANGVPVVFMTGYQDQEPMDRLDRIEHAGCLFKPFDAADGAKAARSMRA